MVTETQKRLGLERPPIAIGFLEAVPENLPAWDGGPVPAGCSFWKAAWEGKAFFTVPADHYNCAVGAHSHRIPLPVAREAELGQTIEFMVESGYLDRAEVPGIPTLADTPRVIAFSPIDAAPFAPSVVLVALPPAQAMLLYEAAVQAGVSPALMPSLGRPACAVLPLALQTGAPAISLGCRGNRTFTDLPESELYLCIPGSHWEAVVERYLSVVSANAILTEHYHQKKEAFR